MDDIEAAYVALGYVDSAVPETQGLDLGALTFRSIALHLPPTMGDDDS